MEYKDGVAMGATSMGLCRGVSRLAWVCACLSVGLGADLRLSELMPADEECLPDENEEYSGWVELENAGAQPLNLEGYALSDDPTRPCRWVFPSLWLPAHEHLVVFASGNDRRTVPSFDQGGTTPPATGPGVLRGLVLWLDAMDDSTLVLDEGRVAEWRDKSGQAYSFQDPAPRFPDQVAGLSLWLDATAPDSLVLENGCVSVWRDRSGQGRDAGQSVAVARPRTDRDAATGARVVRFDGVDDVLGLATELKGRTFFWVAAEDPSAALSGGVVLGHQTEWNLERGLWGAIYRTRTAYVGLPVEYYTWVNGDPVNSTSTPMPRESAVVTTFTTMDCSVDLIGSDRKQASRFWQGVIGEVVAYDRALSTAERDAVTSYLVQKWQPQRPPRSGYRHATQTAQDRRPVLRRDPVSHLPCVALDGVDDYLQFPRVSSIRTAFAVLRERVGTSHDDRPWLGDTVLVDFARGDDGLVYHPRIAVPVVEGANWLDGVRFDPAVTHLPQRWSMLAARPQWGVSANTLSFDRTIAGRVWCGDYAEILLYESSLTDAEVATVQAYLSEKWQLPNRALHTDFELDPEGGVVCLRRPDGTVVDQVAWPALRAGVSVGRSEDSPASVLCFDQPTPGEANVMPGFAALAAAPQVTPASGFYQEPLTITVTAADPDTRIYYTLDGSEPGAPHAEPVEEVWFDDFLPEGAWSVSSPGGPLAWVTWPTPFSGAYAVRTEQAAGSHGDWVGGVARPLVPKAGDRLFVEVQLDPAAPPREVMLLWWDGNWEHGAYWGENLLNYGVSGTAGRVAMGPLPAPGEWVRLEVPAAAVGLEGQAVSGFRVALFDGRVWWDRVGRLTRAQGESQRYTEPVHLSTTTVFRCRAEEPGALPSETVTRSYLFAGSTTFPVISLATDPAGLFDPQIGIYVQGTNASAVAPYYGANFWSDWERPVLVEFFEPDGRLGFSQQAGLRIHGGWTRSAPQKSFELEARRKYGAGDLHYRVFPDLAIDEFDALVLRNFGNDWVGPMIRDPLLQSLMEGAACDLQASRMAHVYLNGQYWGIYDVREKQDRTYVTGHHGPEATPVDIIENDSGVRDGDAAAYQDLWSQVRATNFQQPAAVDAVLARIDADNYIDSELAEIFCDNRDWPQNNTRTWRVRQPEGRWRWMLTDLDAGFAIDDLGAARNTLEVAIEGNPGSSSLQFSVQLLASLIKDTRFRTAFINRAADHLNTRFAVDHVLGRIDRFADCLSPELQRHIDRWSGSDDASWPALQSVAQWNVKVDELRAFARARPDFVWQHFVTFFGLSGTARLELAAGSTSGGSVRLNSLHFALSELPWSGLFFRDVPVEVEAVPTTGYRFREWIGVTETNALLDLVLNRDMQLGVVFEPDPEYDPTHLRPLPHDLRMGAYRFTEWDPAASAGTYPSHMLLMQSSAKDPRLEDSLDGEWQLPYDRTSRSRVTGLGALGLAFLNTGDPQPESGAGYLGGALLALRTTGVSNVTATWTGGTLAPNSRVYGLRLQYRIGRQGSFLDVRDAQGEVVEYQRQPIVGDEAVLGPVELPPETANQPLVQLLWRYHSIPTGASGARAQLRLDEIEVAASTGVVAPVFSAYGVCQDGSFAIAGKALPGITVRIWTSADLLRWTLRGSVQADGTGRLQYTEALLVGRGATFYRLEGVP